MGTHLGSRWAQPGRNRAVTGVCVVALPAYAWIAAGFRPFTWPAAVATSLGALTILAAALSPRRRGNSEAPSRRGGAVWAGWLAVAAGWELWAWSGQPRSLHPTLSSLADSALATHPARSVAVLLWLLSGWRLARQ